jgi:hypothetical protein
MLKKQRCYSTYSEEDDTLVPSIEPYESEKESKQNKLENPKKRLKLEEKLKIFARCLKHERYD